jgi:hypothetical protein
MRSKKIIVSKRYDPWQLCISYILPNCEAGGRGYLPRNSFRPLPCKRLIFHPLHSEAKMFVRFRERKLKFWGDKSLEVILVANRRFGKKVQQRCIKYLGSIPLRRIDEGSWKKDFWRKVSESLATLRLHRDMQNSIEQRISERVPFPEVINGRSESRIPPAGFMEKILLLSQKGKK